MSCCVELLAWATGGAQLGGLPSVLRCRVSLGGIIWMSERCVELAWASIFSGAPGDLVSSRSMDLVLSKLTSERCLIKIGLPLA